VLAFCRSLNPETLVPWLPLIRPESAHSTFQTPTAQRLIYIRKSAVGRGTENVLRFDYVGFRTLHEGDDFVVFGLGNVKRLQRGVNIVVGTSNSRAPAHTGHLCDI